MEMTDKQISIYERLGHQLELTRALLERHPLVSHKLIVLQHVLINFKRQTRWASSGDLAKFLIALEIALIGKSSQESAAGFAGPHWLMLQKAVFSLMKATLNLKERRQADLISILNEIMSLGLIYIATQMLGNWNRLFDQQDLPTAKKAGLLLRELGLTFLLRSRLIETVYESVAKGLDINEKSQKYISDIGLFFLLSLLILVDLQDSPNNEELIEAFIEPLKASIQSVELAVNKAEEQGMMNAPLATSAHTQLQLIKRLLESGDAAAIKQAIENSCQIFDIDYNSVKKDLSQVIHMCEQVNGSFSNIFFQSKLAMTSVTQAA